MLCGSPSHATTSFSLVIYNVQHYPKYWGRHWLTANPSPLHGQPPSPLPAYYPSPPQFITTLPSYHEPIPLPCSPPSHIPTPPPTLIPPPTLTKAWPVPARLIILPSSPSQLTPRTTTPTSTGVCADVESGDESECLLPRCRSMVSRLSSSCSCAALFSLSFAVRAGVCALVLTWFLLIMSPMPTTFELFLDCVDGL